MGLLGTFRFLWAPPTELDSLSPASGPFHQAPPVVAGLSRRSDPSVMKSSGAGSIRRQPRPSFL